MSNDMEKLIRVLQIAGQVAGTLTGNIPAIISLYQLIMKAYDDIKNSPGDFDLDDFQKRLDALPDYEVE